MYILKMLQTIYYVNYPQPGNTKTKTVGVSADKQFLQEWKNRHPVVLYLITFEIELSNQM